MKNMKDYYKILGVSENATEDEIKKVFRQLAMTYHPDRNPDNKEAEEKFKAVSEANEILSDPVKRKEYDAKRRNPHMENSYHGFHDSHFDNLVNEFVYRQQRMRTDSRVDVPLSLSEVLKGAHKQIIFDKKNICQKCKGTGSEKTEKCPICNGVGMLSQRRQQGNMIMETAGPCYNCQGTGYISSGPSCPDCSGIGYKVEHQDFYVDIPSGIPYGVAIRVPTRGHNNSDLNVVFIPDNNDKFQRMGDDIVGTLELSYPEMVLGLEKIVNTIDGALKIKINQYTKPDDKIRLKAQGLPNYHHGGRGDLFMILKLKDVTNITPAEENILQQLANEKNFKS